MAELIPEITPYESVGVTKQPTFVNTNYTNQDFWSLKNRLVQFINERFGPKGNVLPNTFNDLVEGSIAIMLIENWAFIADLLSFKIDQIANEIFIDTVAERENAFRICKVVGFEPLSPIAARTLWTATTNNPLSVDLVIPTPVLIETVAGNTPIAIELFQADSNNEPIFDENIVIPAGSVTSNSIIGLEGITRNDILTSNGEISQIYSTVYAPVIFGSIKVYVDGMPWDRVDYFSESQPKREYRVEFDSDYRAYIIFGNNRAGLIPSNGSSVLITYRNGGGIIGNIVTGSLIHQLAVPVEGIAPVIPIILQNYTKGEYGYDGDTVDDIRIKLPQWIRTQDRAVSGEDYKTLVDQFATPYHGAIGKSAVLLRNYGCAANIIDIYVLARGDENSLELASNELKVDLSSNINDKKMITDYVCIKDGEVILVDINVEVTLNKFYKKFENEIKQQITNKITSFFSLNSWEYDQDLKSADLARFLSDTKEVTSFTINFTTSDPENSGELVTAKYYQIIRPDTVTVWMNYE